MLPSLDNFWGLLILYFKRLSFFHLYMCGHSSFLTVCLSAAPSIPLCLGNLSKAWETLALLSFPSPSTSWFESESSLTDSWFGLPFPSWKWCSGLLWNLEELSLLVDLSHQDRVLEELSTSGPQLAHSASWSAEVWGVWLPTPPLSQPYFSLSPW